MNKDIKVKSKSAPLSHSPPQNTRGLTAAVKAVFSAGGTPYTFSVAEVCEQLAVENCGWARPVVGRKLAQLTKRGVLDRNGTGCYHRHIDRARGDVLPLAPKVELVSSAPTISPIDLSHMKWLIEQKFPRTGQSNPVHFCLVAGLNPEPEQLYLLRFAFQQGVKDCILEKLIDGEEYRWCGPVAEPAPAYTGLSNIDTDDLVAEVLQRIVKQQMGDYGRGLLVGVLAGAYPKLGVLR